MFWTARDPNPRSFAVKLPLLAVLAASVVILVGWTSQPVSAAALAHSDIVPVAASTDAGYITTLRQYFGLNSSDDQLKALLNDQVWGETAKNYADLAAYGDHLKQPDDIAAKTETAIINGLLGNVAKIPLDLFPHVEAIVSIYEYAQTLMNSPVLQVELQDGFATALEVTTALSDLKGSADVAAGAASLGPQLVDWGTLAPQESKWRQLVSEYESLRDQAQTPPQARISMVTAPELAPFYFPIIENLTNTNFPIYTAPFVSQDQLFRALEQAHFAIQLGSNSTVQSQIAVLLDLAATTQVYNGLIAVQTNPNLITLRNAGPTTVAGLSLTRGGNNIPTNSSVLPPGTEALVYDPQGYSLSATDGTATFSVGGGSPISDSFASIRRNGWVGAISGSSSGLRSYSFAAQDLLLGADGGYSSHWNFGDGYTSSELSPMHTYACPGDYTTTLTITGPNGSPITSVSIVVSMAPTNSFDWLLNAGAISISPGISGDFTTSGVSMTPSSNGQTPGVAWNFDDGFIFPNTATGFSTSHTFSGSVVRRVSATYTDTEGCLTTKGKWISVGNPGAWMQLPSEISSDFRLPGNVAGYWTDQTVKIDNGVSLTFEGTPQIRSSADVLFTVGSQGQLHITGGQITSTGDPVASQPANDPAAKPVGSTFIAVEAGAGSTIEVSNVKVDLARTLVKSSGSTKITLNNDLVTGASSAVVADSFGSLNVQGSSFVSGGAAINISGSGNATIDSTTFKGGGGVVASGYMRLAVTSSIFNNTSFAARLSDRAWRSSFSSSQVLNGGGAVQLTGASNFGVTHLSSDLPYLASSVTVPVGSSVVVDPGVVIKVQGNSASYFLPTGFSVAGSFTTAGTEASPVTFTSFADDSVGGDSNGNGAVAPIGQDWSFASLTVNGAGQINVNHAHVLGGNYFIGAVPGSAWAGGWGTDAGNGGIVTVTNSDISANSSVYSTANLAAITVDSSTFHDGSGISSQGVTALTITNSDLGTAGISATSNTSVDVEHSRFAALNVTNTAATTITDNILVGSKTIHLSNAAIGATVLRNVPFDGVGGIVTLFGATPAGVTHLSSNLPYLASSVTVPVGSSVVVDPGVVIKVEGTNSYFTPTGFNVAGSFTTAGTEASPVTFTSFADDSVGGDSNGNGAVAPTAVDQRFAALGIAGAGQINIDHARSLSGTYFIAAVPGRQMNYGDNWGTGAGTGGIITVTNSDIAANSSVYSTADLAAITINASTFHDGSGISSKGATALTITNSDLGTAGLSATSNTSVDVEHSRFTNLNVTNTAATTITDNILVGAKTISLSNASIGATVLRNVPFDGIGGVVTLSGFTPAGVIHLSSNLPYLPSSVTVPAGSSVVVDPGVVIKVKGDSDFTPSGFNVAGSFTAAGTEASPVTFTSFADDSVGGDSNGNGAVAPTGADQSFAALGISEAGQINIDHARALSGAYFIAAVPGQRTYYGDNWGTRAGTGGIITVTNSDIAANYSVYSTANLAAITITSSTFHTGQAITVQGAGSVTADFERNLFLSVSTALRINISAMNLPAPVIRSNDFSGASIGVSSLSPIDATANWWGDAGGPGYSLAATASSAVVVRPWCLDASCTSLSPAPITGLKLTSPQAVQIVAGATSAPATAMLTAQNQNNVERTFVQFILTGDASFTDGTSSASVTSMPDGTIATPSVRANNVPGTATLTIQAGDYAASVTYTVVAAAPAALSTLSGGGEYVVAGATIQDYKASVKDAFGNPVSGMATIFSVTGGVTFTSGDTNATTLTDSLGTAISPSFLAGSAAGPFQVKVNVGSLTATYSAGRVSLPGQLTFSSTPVPVVSGVAAVGETLTAHTGSWAPDPVALKIQWYQGSMAISGATGSTYVVQATDVGAALSVQVTGSEADYTTVTVPSVSTSTIPQVKLAPKITSSSPNGATVGAGYSFIVTASGTPTPSFTITSGQLPPGLILDETTGLISGTPTTPGTSTLTITADNGATPAASAIYTVVVAAAPAVPVPPVVPPSVTAPAAPFASDAGIVPANQGTVTGSQSGNITTVTLPDINFGSQIFVYGYSSPLYLGSFVVNSAHQIVVSTSALPAGPHHLVVLDATGVVIGWTALTVPGIDVASENPTFADVSDPSYVFYPFIQWMASSGISTGTAQVSGKPLYKPADAVSRQAMASFLFKLSGETFVAPSVSTFADVDPSATFFTAIEWMASKGISTGTPQPSGKPLFKPTDPVSRQAMALFLARYAHTNLTVAPTVQSFADVPLDAAAAAAVKWMKDTGISTGTIQSSGLPLYKPVDPVSRSAMAAFLYRLAHLPV
jgi:hypothetical protein